MSHEQGECTDTYSVIYIRPVFYDFNRSYRDAAGPR